MQKPVFRTSFGWMGIVLSAEGIAYIALPRKSRKETEGELKRAARERGISAESPLAKTALEPLRKYFSGKEVKFDLPLDLGYYTAFQRAVWKAAAAIPYGETRSYAWIAKRIGRPKAARAVGQAMGANPIPIIIP
jgi:O6-methylguanine-DNA--protein-cysteine methyltransferase